MLHTSCARFGDMVALNMQMDKVSFKDIVGTYVVRYDSKTGKYVEYNPCDNCNINHFWFDKNLEK